MSKRGLPTWLLLIFAGIGLLLVGIPGLWVFMSLTAKPIHPTSQSVPTVTLASPPAAYSTAVLQARQAVRTSVAAQNLPAVSVAVGIDGEIVWAEGFGLADLKNEVPVTPNHRFRIGTASAALTSAAAGVLLEEDRLKLDDEIQAYVPMFPRKQWAVTLHSLMAHTAGLISDGGDEGPLFNQHCAQPAEALQYFAERPLLFQPGTQYRLSRYGWILVSAAIESVARQPFLTFMRQRVFEPLGMRDTVADPGPDPSAAQDEDFPLVNLARELFHDPEAKRGAAARSSKSAPSPATEQVTSYFPRFAADPKHGMHLMRPLDYSCYSGASVFVSTPSDLVRFGMAMNRAKEGKFLKPATVDLLQSSQRLSSGAETGHGLGWSRKTVTLAGSQTLAIGQNGDSLGGTIASLMTFPEHGITVAVTSNISYSDTPAIALKVAESFVDHRKSPTRN